MTVFDFPPQALAETACFSVLSRCGAEELFIVPPRALPDGDVPQDAWVYFHAPQTPPERLPITPRTLVPEYLADRFPENPVMVSSQPRRLPWHIPRPLPAANITPGRVHVPALFILLYALR